MAFDVVISGESIKLGQFLKVANLVESGGHAKELINAGEVSVNGEVVRARGHLLFDGDYFDERTANDDFDPEKWRNM